MPAPAAPEAPAPAAPEAPAPAAPPAPAPPAPEPAPPAAPSHASERSASIVPEPPALGAGTVLALRTGLAAWAAIVVVGFAMAVVTSDTWILGFLGYGEGLTVETARQALAAMYARFSIEGDSFLHGLHLMALAPVLAAGLTARRMRPSTAGLTALARAGWCVAATIPFLALCTPLVALAEHGRIDVEGRSVLFYALVLVGGGALIGTFGLPGRPGALIKAALAPLGVAVAVLSAVGTLLIGGLILTNQMPRVGYDLAQLPRGTPDPRELRLDAGSALLQSTLAVVNYGTAYTTAGFLSEAKGDAVFPITDARFARLSQAEQSIYIECLFSSDCGPTVRIFDGSRELPILLFLPVVWLMLLVPWSAAVFAGYAIARQRGPGSVERAIAWGALAGPIWALTLTFLEAIGSGGSTDLGSTFRWTLFLATVLGAIGGRMSVRADPRTTNVDPSAPRTTNVNPSG